MQLFSPPALLPPAAPVYLALTRPVACGRQKQHVGSLFPTESFIDLTAQSGCLQMLGEVLVCPLLGGPRPGFPTIARRLTSVLHDDEPAQLRIAELSPLSIARHEPNQILLLQMQMSCV